MISVTIDEPFSVDAYYDTVRSIDSNEDEVMYVAELFIHPSGFNTLMRAAREYVQGQSMIPRVMLTVDRNITANQFVMQFGQ